MKHGDDSRPDWTTLSRQQAKEPPPSGEKKDPLDELEPPPSPFFPVNRVYVPYDTRSRPVRLILLTAKLPAQAPVYPQLDNFLYDQHYGRHLTLLYPDMAVQINGELLGEVIHALYYNKCAIIREWHADFYDAADPAGPVIREIKITPLNVRVKETE